MTTHPRLKAFFSQFARPQGTLGVVAAFVMAVENRKTNERLVDLAGLRDGDRAIDVGCGPGMAVRHAARVPGVTVTGVDVSETSIAVARSLTASRPGRSLRSRKQCCTPVCDRRLHGRVVDELGAPLVGSRGRSARSPPRARAGRPDRDRRAQTVARRRSLEPARHERRGTRSARRSDQGRRLRRHHRPPSRSWARIASSRSRLRHCERARDVDVQAIGARGVQALGTLAGDASFRSAVVVLREAEVAHLA